VIETSNKLNEIRLNRLNSRSSKIGELKLV